jgi:hypothetical protein
VQSADYYLRKAGECAVAAREERNPLDAALFRAFEHEFLERAIEAEDPSGEDS